ncbi:MAG: hypothetical protein V4556_00730 [Bacteroidota bacterium]
MKYLIATFIWVVVTLFFNYQMAYNSTYQSDAPDVKFWNRLPVTALICAVIVIFIFIIYLAIAKSKKDD